MFSGFGDFLALGLGFLTVGGDDEKDCSPSEAPVFKPAKVTRSERTRPLTHPERGRKRRGLDLLFRVVSHRLALEKMRAFTEWRCSTVHKWDAPFGHEPFETYRLATLAATQPDDEDVSPVAPLKSPALQLFGSPVAQKPPHYASGPWPSARRRTASARRARDSPPPQEEEEGPAADVGALESLHAGIASFKGNISRLLYAAASMVTTPAATPLTRARTRAARRTAAVAGDGGERGSPSSSGDEARQAMGGGGGSSKRPSAAATLRRGAGLHVRATSSPPAAAGSPAATASAAAGSERHRVLHAETFLKGALRPPPSAIPFGHLLQTPASRLHRLGSQAPAATAVATPPPAQRCGGAGPADAAALPQPHRPQQQQQAVPPPPPGSAGSSAYVTAAEEEEGEGEGGTRRGALPQPPLTHRKGTQQQQQQQRAEGREGGSSAHASPTLAGEAVPTCVTAAAAAAVPVPAMAEAAAHPPQPPSSATTEATTASAAADASAQLELLAPYLKMLKAGVPEPALRARMAREGCTVTPSGLRRALAAAAAAPPPPQPPRNDGESRQQQDAGGAQVAEEDPALAASLAPFRQLARMGAPPEAVAARMRAKGLDPALLQQRAGSGGSSGTATAPAAAAVAAAAASAVVAVAAARLSPGGGSPSGRGRAGSASLGGSTSAPSSPASALQGMLRARVTTAAAAGGGGAKAGPAAAAAAGPSAKVGPAAAGGAKPAPAPPAPRSLLPTSARLQWSEVARAPPGSFWAQQQQQAEGGRDDSSGGSSILPAALANELSLLFLTDPTASASAANAGGKHGGRAGAHHHGSSNSAAPPQHGNAGAPAPSPAPAQALVSVIDSRRAGNIAIVLSRFSSVPWAALQHAVMALDPNATAAAFPGAGVTEESLRALAALAPTAEERAALARHCASAPGAEASLAPPDRHLHRVGTAPGGFMPRARLLLARLDWAPGVASAASKAAALETACAQLQGSPTFGRLLRLVLALGNALNAHAAAHAKPPAQQKQQLGEAAPAAVGGEATAAAGAAVAAPAPPPPPPPPQLAGFSLDSLVRLSTTRAYDRKTSALAFVVQAWVTLEEASGSADAVSGAQPPPGLAAALRSELSAALACGGAGLGIDAAEAEARQLRAIQRQAASLLASQQAQAAQQSATSAAPAAAVISEGPVAAAAAAAAEPAVDGLPRFASEAAAACDAIDASVSRAKAAYASLLTHYAMSPGGGGGGAGCPATYATLSGEGLLRDMAAFVREVAATEAKIRERLARAARAAKTQAAAARSAPLRRRSQGAPLPPKAAEQAPTLLPEADASAVVQPAELQEQQPAAVGATGGQGVGCAKGAEAVPPATAVADSPDATQPLQDAAGANRASTEAAEDAAGGTRMSESPRAVV